MKISLLLFEGFETLDLCGPIEILARVPGHELSYYSMQGGMIESAQNMKIMTEQFSGVEKGGAIVLPGGRGTRPLALDKVFLSELKVLCENAGCCLSVCTGSALFAAAGVLNGKKATSNKKAFQWVESVSNEVIWKPSARWVVDGKYYTSSGVSAGMDMSLGFVEDQYGSEAAMEIAENIEYLWNRDKDNDPFAVGADR